MSLGWAGCPRRRHLCSLPRGGGLGRARTHTGAADARGEPMTAEGLAVRERFVEAMRQFKTIHEDWFGHEDLSAAFRQAIEAFADAECAMRCEGFNAGLESVSA